ncbi:hypothetical protein [Nocardioides lianchengensis]|uniref:WD40 repeat domain-containing protein n=1 Tax=Nocardioides lianchengensis TaxID=1045774 RepID=A0A1G6NT47_9ACTN|nr:hypothetical protein [Nocardioides lianchengensis]NYG10884.1 hypothetical protein [Nocardioides lianchengensis]SDC71170.1 hypothetical protein SAMN05421872_103369 [Nocardioides lianchengensis]
MTDRLSTLLHDEAAALDVPPPSPAAVLRRGRAVRRRRSTTRITGAGVVAGLALAAALVAVSRGDTPRTVEPAEPEPGAVADTGVTFTLGTTLWYDDATRSVQVPDAAVKSLYYTSAGVLVRHGDNGYSDGGGEQRFSLVTPDGEIRPVGVVTEEVAHTTDPAQPYLAWTQSVDGVAELVVHDVSTDQEVARVALPDLDTDGFQQTVLTGDTAYVSSGDESVRVSWRSGETESLDEVITEVGGEHALVDGSVIDLDSGLTVYRPRQRDVWLDLSPDGRYLLLGREVSTGTSFSVVDLDEQRGAVRLAGPTPYTWTAGSELASVSVGEVAVCAPDTGVCAASLKDFGMDEQEFRAGLRLGGATYES